MISNLNVYRAIAESALAESQRVGAMHTSPKPGDEVGHVIIFDPSRTSLKQAMVAIVFLGIYLEALFWIAGVKRFGKAYKAIDKLQYEDRLSHFGINAPELFAALRRFRKARNDLVHEKAIAINELKVMNFAQTEAGLARDVIKQIEAELNRQNLLNGGL